MLANNKSLSNIFTSKQDNSSLLFSGDNIFIQLSDNSESSLEDARSNNLTIIDYEECKKKLIEKRIIDNNTNIYSITTNIKSNNVSNKNNTIGNHISYFKLIDDNGKLININECDEMTIKIPVDEETPNLNNYSEYKYKYDVDIYNKDDRFFNDICFAFNDKINNTDSDLTLNTRRKFFNYSIECSNSCKYNGLDEYNYSQCKCFYNNLKNDNDSNKSNKSSNTAETNNNTEYNYLKNSVLNSILSSNFELVYCYKEAFNFTKSIDIQFYTIISLTVIWISSILIFNIFIQKSLILNNFKNVIMNDVILSNVRRINNIANSPQPSGKGKNNQTLKKNSPNTMNTDKSNYNLNNKNSNNSNNKNNVINNKTKSIKINKDVLIINSNKDNKLINNNEFINKHNDNKNNNIKIINNYKIIDKNNLILNSILSSNSKNNGYSTTNNFIYKSCDSGLYNTTINNKYNKDINLLKSIKKQRNKSLDTSNIQKDYCYNNKATSSNESIFFEIKNNMKKYDYSYKELESMKIIDRIKLDKRNMLLVWWYELKVNHEFLCIFFVVSIIRPFYVRLTIFVNDVVLTMALNCLFYSDSYIENEYKFKIENNNASPGIFYTISNEIFRLLWPAVISAVLNNILNLIIQVPKRISNVFNNIIDTSNINSIIIAK